MGTAGSLVLYCVLVLLGLALECWILFAITRAAMTSALQRVLKAHHETVVHQNGLIVKSLAAHTDLLKAIAAGGPEA